MEIFQQVKQSKKRETKLMFQVDDRSSELNSAV